jgi:hypothetical protein
MTAYNASRTQSGPTLSEYDLQVPVGQTGTLEFTCTGSQWKVN